MEELGESIQLNQRGVEGKVNKLKAKLEETIYSKNIDEFRRILSDLDEADRLSTLESCGSGSRMSVFELACRTSDSSDFIKYCIFVGCDVNKKNIHYGDRPVSYTITYSNDENFEALLSDTSVCIDFEVSSNDNEKVTPINWCIGRISSKYDDIVKRRSLSYIELLVKCCADVNIPDQNGRTPIRNILVNECLSKREKTTLVKFFFDHAKYIDVDDGNGAVRTQLHELMPDLELPPIRIQGNQKMDVDQLMLSLESGNEAEFWQYFTIGKAQFIALLEDHWHHAVVVAVKKGLKYSVERMLRSCLFDVRTLDKSEHPYRSPRRDPLLIHAIRSIKWSGNRDPNIEKCLSLLMSHQKIDINARSNFGYTAMFHAVLNEYPNLTTKLLEGGAYIGSKNRCGFISIFNIKPKLLENHFDSCVAVESVDDKNGETSSTLIFDYKNFIPTDSEFSEMDAIECILERSTLRHVLKHPLIEHIIDIKWQRLAFIFYINFFFCASFALLNVFYILGFFLGNSDSDALIVASKIMLLCLVARETFQVIISPCVYFKSFKNYLECVLIALFAFILFGSCPSGWRGTVAATAILLIGYEFFVLIGSLPLRSVAMHYVMLKTVTTSFVKSLLIYSTIIVVFALSFYSLFHKPSETNENKSNETVDEQRLEKYNNFQSVGLSMLKTIVMAIGELDASSIQFNGNVLSYIVFVAFTLFVTTVLGNLLNGLAVSDINEIKTHAEWTHLIQRCQDLARYERIFRGIHYRFPKIIRFVRSKVCAYPGFPFKLHIKVKDQSIRNSAGNLFRQTKSIFCSDQGYQIDGDILKGALEKVYSKQNDENEMEMLRNQISKIADANSLLVHSVGKTMKSIEEHIRKSF